MQIKRVENIIFTDKNDNEVKPGEVIQISFKANKRNVIGTFKGFGKRKNTIIISSNEKDFTLETKYFEDVVTE